jgi:solute:Na+ symporter, SSS family
MNEVTASMAPLDWAIVGAYMIGIIALGLFASRGQADAKDYFLASRSSTWPTIGLALIGSNISATTLIGLAGAAYTIGISVFNYEWMASVVLAVYCIFFLPAVLRSQVYTMPEFLERRFSPSIRLYFSGLTIFLNIVVDTAATLFGGALLFKLLFPGMPLWQLASILAITAGIYTAVGGLRAVMITEVVQTILLLGASVFIAYFAFDKAGGWNNVMDNVAPEKLSLIRPLDDKGVPWLGLITGVPLLGFYFWCTNQFMAQRVMSAKTLEHGRWGSLFAGLLKLPILFLMVLPGTAAILIYPNLSNGDLVYPKLIFDLLPVGVVGIVIAGFLAAIMSSIASTFNSASTLVTMDFARKFAPGLSQASLVLVGRITTLALMALSIAWIPVIEKHATSLWQYIQAVLAYAVPPIVALFVLGLFWKRANAVGARTGLVIGTLTGIFLFVSVEVTKTLSIHFLTSAAVIFVIALLATSLASLLRPAPQAAAVETLMWRKADYDAETAHLATRPMWQNYRLQALALLVITAVLVWWWR